jgi:predicted ATPase
MIKFVEFENFKAFKKVTIPLEPLTVFVGANASGKTSVLEGLNILSYALVGPNLTATSQAFEELYKRGGEGPMKLAVSASQEGENKRFELTSATIEPGVFGWERSASMQPSDLGILPIFRFEAKRLAAPSPTLLSQGIPRLVDIFENLAPVLAHIALTEPERFGMLKVGMRSIVPSIREIRFNKFETSPQAYGYQLVFDMKGAPNIRASQVSSGTLLALAILTVVIHPSRPQLVLLDDIEQGLHPMAQVALISLLRKIMEQNPELQVLATTHSPYLLSALKPEEVRLTIMDEQGEAHCASLTDSPDFEKWKDELTPGEMWSVLGEDWVLKLQGQGAR